MITLGLDPHPDSHTVVALDERGVSLGHLTVPNTAEGLMQLCEFSTQFMPVIRHNHIRRHRIS
jgi:hypothetical protein